MVGKLTGWEQAGVLPPAPAESDPDRSATEPIEDQDLVLPDRPKGNASRQAWVDYLDARGIVVKDTDTRADLIEVADSLGL